MSYFLHEDFLLQSQTAKYLYHDYAKQMPVIDYHCHLPPDRIDGNEPFSNLTDIWLRGDHYKWRAMRTLGIDESLITGNTSDEEKFLQWAKCVPYTMRNPLYHWTHLELKNPFGIEELLSEKNAAKVYSECNAMLQQPDFFPRGLLEHFNVQVVVSTDDPCDSLQHHCNIASSGFQVKVLPCFRPDKVLQLSGGESYRDYIRRLSEASHITIKKMDDLLQALSNRIDYFHERGGRLADHGLNYIPIFTSGAKDADALFRQVMEGNDKEAERGEENFAGYVLYELSKMYHSKGWVQQFHLGALRNNNRRMLTKAGPDTGFDSIGDERQAEKMSRFFNLLDSTDQLSPTVIYNLNPADNEVFASMIGNFNDGTMRGKMQFGSGWWFLDQKDGMEKQMNALSNIGLLSCFIGMLTDSRSFLSYSRHEYFRRILCNLIGEDISKGLLPNDISWLGKMVQDICYYNAKNYFSFNL